MWKSIVAGTAALAIVGTSMVYAQRGREEGRERWQPSMEDFRAFGEARLAALEDRLRAILDNIADGMVVNMRSTCPPKTSNTAGPAPPL